mmetsp:Transcript_33128/g.24368  ORF Transcript_33128/g.24368 Transcript_33128/m.24368 type:complete len:80 (-) Transcript_33128:23-262(-)
MYPIILGILYYISFGGTENHLLFIYLYNTFDKRLSMAVLFVQVVSNLLLIPVDFYLGKEYFMILFDELVNRGISQKVQE